MALNGWTKKCVITIFKEHLTRTGEFPFLLHSDSLPTGLTVEGGPDACKPDGGDLRFSYDSSGDDLLPYSVMDIKQTQTGGYLLVFVRLNITNKNNNKSFYMHWGNPDAGTPLATDPIGSASCFSELYGFNFFQEDPADYTGKATWKFAKDITTRYSGFSKEGDVDLGGSMPVPDVKTYNIGTGKALLNPEIASMGNTDAFGVFGWIKPDTIDGKQMFMTEDQAVNQIRGVGWEDGKAMSEWQETWNTVILKAGVWQLVGFFFDGTAGELRCYGDGDTVTLSTTNAFNITRMGENQDETFNGEIACFFTTRETPMSYEWLDQMKENWENVVSMATSTSIMTVTVTVPVSVEVKTVMGDPIQGARVFLQKVSDSTVLVNDETDSNGKVSFSYSYTGDTPVKGRVRRGTASPYYKTAVMGGTINSAGMALEVFMVKDS